MEYELVVCETVNRWSISCVGHASVEIDDKFHEFTVFHTSKFLNRITPHIAHSDIRNGFTSLKLEFIIL
jgi:hypothetical protein